MDFLFWIGWISTIAVFVYVCLIIVGGAGALVDASWDHEFRVLGSQEWGRRGLAGRKLTVSEAACKHRFLGVASPAPDPAERARERDALQALTEIDRATLERLLAEHGNHLLMRARARVSGSVQTIASVEYASRMWMVQRCVARLGVSLHGVWWLTRHAGARLIVLWGRYSVSATIVGIVVGLLWWGLFSDPGADSGSGAAWGNFLGVVVTVSTVLALTAAIGKHCLAVIVASYGPASTWTRTGILSAVLWCCATVGMLTAVKIGAWASWQRQWAAAVADLTATPVVFTILGVAFLLVFTAWYLRNALRWARARWVQTSDRILALCAAITLAATSGCIITLLIAGPERLAMWAVGAILTIWGCFGGLTGCLAILRWSSKYRALRRAGIAVNQGGFRWWALVTWVGTFVLVCGAGLLPVPEAEGVMGHAVLGVKLLAIWGGVLLAVAILPGCVVTSRFALRVNRMFAALESARATRAEPARFSPPPLPLELSRSRFPRHALAKGPARAHPDRRRRGRR